jgi:hypothetical protein
VAQAKSYNAADVIYFYLGSPFKSGESFSRAIGYDIAAQSIYV